MKDNFTMGPSDVQETPKSLTFGEALEAVKQGKLIARHDWNGRNMFVFQRPEDYIPVDIVINNVKSLPQAVKDYFKMRNEDSQTESLGSVKFTSYLCMKAADDTIVNGWLASQTDMLSEDWYVIN